MALFISWEPALSLSDQRDSVSSLGAVGTSGLPCAGWTRPPAASGELRAGVSAAASLLTGEQGRVAAWYFKTDLNHQFPFKKQAHKHRTSKGA